MMASLEDIIKREVNPFDPVTFCTGNFWQESQNSELMVGSIHQEVLNTIIKVLSLVSKDHKTRSLLLCGTGGSGKSYLLARLKKQLNSKAFFAYIGPWTESDHIYRHILRQTVDSLMHIPEGKKESQLLLWLKTRAVFKNRSFMKRILGERHLFIKYFKDSYKEGIYHPDKFFGVLYSLTNPDLYDSACQWLRGDDLDEDNLKALGLNKSIETETDAYNILTNLGRISSETQPIVLCFDQIDKKVIPQNGYRDLQSLFSVNTTIHNENLKNFLIIISLVTETWRLNEKHILESDRERLIGKILLKKIDLDQAESLWEKRLFPLHQQTNPQPQSPISPLSRQQLEEKFPGGKTTPRDTLGLGEKLIQEYKIGSPPPPIDLIAAFRLVWRNELNKTSKKYTKISQIADIDLVEMLRETLTALAVKNVQNHLLSSKTFASHSLSYLLANQRVGVVWGESTNMKSFSALMKACEATIQPANSCEKLYLIRAAEMGKSKTTQGYKLYTKIFTNSSHQHLHPHLNSVWYLVTYHSLVNAACAGELVVGDKIPNLQELQTLIRDSQVLNDCQLLQDLGIVKMVTHPTPQINLKPMKTFLLDLVKTQKMMGLQTLINNALSQFPEVNQSQIEKLIQELSQENRIAILDPKAKFAEQLVNFVPQKS